MGSSVSDALPAGMGTESLGEKPSHCAEHGEFASRGMRYFGRREVWTRCPMCEQSEADRHARAAAQQRAQAEQERLGALLEMVAIPRRFVGCTFDSYKPQTPEQVTALARAREFAEQFPRHRKDGTGLILAGMPGTGKSHLAGAILQAILPHHVGLYTTLLALIRSVRSTWRRDSERSESDVLAELGGVDLLVVDEVGVQYETDGERAIIFDVLDRRYRERMPTILITNQDVKGVKTCVGERTFDRLAETCLWVPFTGASYRPTARQEQRS